MITNEGGEALQSREGAGWKEVEDMRRRGGAGGREQVSRLLQLSLMNSRARRATNIMKTMTAAGRHLQRS
jgi:hypothetical protein